MSVAVRRLLWNPILAREVRSRMRGRRAYLTLTVFLGLVGGAGLLAYKGQDLSLTDPYAPTVAGARLFATLFACVIALTLLITPGLCASAISSEREHQTLDLLLCTPMGAGRIILGKLLSSLLFVLLLIVATVPLFALVFFLGGVGAGQVVVALVVCLASALMAGSLGLLCSTLLRRTPAATLAAYLLLFAVLMLPMALGFFSSTLNETRVTGYTPPDCSRSIGSFNCPPADPPNAAVVLLASTSPVTATVATLQTLPTSTSTCAVANQYSFSSASTPCATTVLADRDRVQVGSFGGWRVWQVTLVGQGIVVVLCLGGAVVALRGPRRVVRPAAAGPPPAAAPAPERAP